MYVGIAMPTVSNVLSGIADAAARGELAKPTVVYVAEDDHLNEGELFRYIREKANCEDLECPLCFVRMGSLAAARRHLDEHYPRDSPVCPVASCARVFAHPNSVRNHMRIKHQKQWNKMKTLKWSCGWAN